MHRFIVSECPLPGKHVTFSKEESAHAFLVLRLRAGEKVEVSDGAGTLAEAELQEVSRDAVTALVQRQLPGNESPVKLTLYQGYPKADKLEWIIQKLTELGAVRIVPVVMARSVARPAGKDAEKKCERLKRIAFEAAKQCGRARVPEVDDALSWNEALMRFKGHELALMPWEDAHDVHLRGIYSAFPQVSDIALLIGPEGGISAAEAEQAIHVGAHAVTLGPRILRTETAAITASALVMSLWGDV